MESFFSLFAARAFRILVPGGHLLIASSPLLSHLVYLPLMRAGFEKRGELIRLVQTLRGGDRPKNAHEEFADVTVMPRSCWEPWGIFRKPCEGRVQDNLRKWKTGGLRRPSQDAPFADVIASAPTRQEERRDCSPPVLEAASVHAAGCARLPPARRWCRAGSIYGRRIHHGSSTRRRLSEHRRGVRCDVLRLIDTKRSPMLSALAVNGTTRIIKTNDVVSLNGKGRSDIGFLF